MPRCGLHLGLVDGIVGNLQVIGHDICSTYVKLGDASTAAVPCHVMGIALFPLTQPAELGFHAQLEDLDLSNCHLECRDGLDLKVCYRGGCESATEYQERGLGHGPLSFDRMRAPIDSLHEFPKAITPAACVAGPTQRKTGHPIRPLQIEADVDSPVPNRG